MYPVQIQSGLQMLPLYLVFYVHTKVILPDLQNHELQKGFQFYWIYYLQMYLGDRKA